jgi:hypothetical protein
MCASSSSPTPATSSVTLIYLERMLRSLHGRRGIAISKRRSALVSTYITIMEQHSGENAIALRRNLENILCEMSSKELSTALTTLQALETSARFLAGPNSK